MTVVLSGQLTKVRTTTGGNSEVVVLPASVTATTPTNLKLGSDFGTVNVRVAVFNDVNGWRIYDPYVIVDSNGATELDLEVGDSKLSLGIDSTATGIVGWTVTAAI